MAKAKKAPGLVPDVPTPPVDAAVAQVRAVLAFSHPHHGTWRRGESRSVPVDESTIALVDSGYLEPVWDGTPTPDAAAPPVQVPSQPTEVTVYRPASSGSG